MEGWKPMGESYPSRGGFVLVKSPNARHQAARRRALAACGVLALALASGVIGILNHPAPEPLGKPHTGPFSYLPSE
jgi:hypothetical protein